MENRKDRQDQRMELGSEDLEIVAGGMMVRPKEVGGLVRPTETSDNPFEDIPRVPNQDIPNDWRPTT